jgi:hypothetical protein
MAGKMMDVLMAGLPRETIESFRKRPEFQPLWEIR